MRRETSVPAFVGDEPAVWTESRIAPVGRELARLEQLAGLERDGLEKRFAAWRLEQLEVAVERGDVIATFPGVVRGRQSLRGWRNIRAADGRGNEGHKQSRDRETEARARPNAVSDHGGNYPCRRVSGLPRIVGAAKSALQNQLVASAPRGAVRGQDPLKS